MKFSHSCVCERSIYPTPTYFPAAEQADRSEEYINRSQKHECKNWDCSHAVPFLGIFASNFRYCVFAVQIQSMQASKKDGFVKRKIIHRNPRSWAPSQYWATPPPPSITAFHTYYLSHSSLCVCPPACLSEYWRHIRPGSPTLLLGQEGRLLLYRSTSSEAEFLVKIQTKILRILP